MISCFQKWRKLEEGLDELDGDAMGISLMKDSSGLFSKNLGEARVTNFLEEFRCMKSLKEEYVFLESMLRAIVVVGWKDGRVGGAISPSERKLATLTEKDGIVLGLSFLRLLGAAATEEGAFASWILKYLCLADLDNKFPFFRPLMIKIGKEIRHKVSSASGE